MRKSLLTKLELVRGQISILSEQINDISAEVCNSSSDINLSDTEKAVITAMRGEAPKTSGEIIDTIEVPVKVKVSIDMEQAENNVVSELTEEKPKRRKRRTKAEMAAAKESIDVDTDDKDDNDDLTTSSQDSEEIFEEDIIHVGKETSEIKEKPKKKAKEKVDLKKDAPLPDEPEELTLSSVREYAGAVMRALDNGVEFHKTVNKAIEDAGLSEIALMDDDEVDAAFEVIQIVVADFADAQISDDNKKWGGE